MAVAGWEEEEEEEEMLLGEVDDFWVKGRGGGRSETNLGVV